MKHFLFLILIVFINIQSCVTFTAKNNEYIFPAFKIKNNEIKEFFINKKGDIIGPEIDKIVDGNFFQPLFLDHEFYKIMKNNKIGYVNIKGELIPMIYEDGKYFREGLCPVKKGGKWGYINKKGDIVIDFNFNYAEVFSDELANVNGLQFINKQGDIVLDLDSSKEIISTRGFFKNGLLVITNKQNLQGYINKQGEIVIKPQFGSATSFFNTEITGVTIKSKRGIINRQGTLLALVKKELTFILFETAWLESIIIKSTAT